MKECSIYLFSVNDPAIEASEALRFGPFNIGYPGLAEHVVKAGLDSGNRWELVHDYSAKKNPGVVCWDEIDPEDWSTQLLEIPDFETEEPAALHYDYPLRYGGTLSD